MDRVHARYPFLEGARTAVADQAVDLESVIEHEPAVVERARERVITALQDGTTGEPHRDPRVELLSYPIARILVSVVDEWILIRRYASGEAAAAYEAFTADFEHDDALRSVERETIDRATILTEFGLDEQFEADGDRYWLDVGAYLPLSSTLRGEQWRLVNRALTDGRVPVSDPELLVLLREAIRARVEDGLPLAVPDEVAATLEEDVETIREVLAEMELTREIDTVVPDLFPPCMKALLDGIQSGEHLPHHSRFAITAFLTSIGMSTDDIVDIYRVNSSFGEEMTRYQTDHIRGETSPTEYSPPSCATMQSYGDCVNMDDLCEEIPHPMAYYEERLDQADEDELEDWRETTETEA